MFKRIILFLVLSVFLFATEKTFVRQCTDKASNMDEYLMSFISGRFYSNWVGFTDRIGITIGALVFLRNNKE